MLVASSSLMEGWRDQLIQHTSGPSKFRPCADLEQGEFTLKVCEFSCSKRTVYYVMLQPRFCQPVSACFEFRPACLHCL